MFYNYVDLHESKEIARKILNQEGYGEYEITTHWMTVGTNVTTIVAKKGNSTIELTLLEGIKQVIGNKEKVTHTILIEEDLNSSMATSGNKVILTFDLEQSIPIGGKIINRSDIELVMAGNNCVSIKMIVSDIKKETIDNATEVAERVANYLSHQTNYSTKLKKPRVTVIDGNKATHTLNYTVDTAIFLPCDVDLQNISPLIDSNSILNQRLIRYKEGIKSLNEGDPAKAFQQFHQAIEGSKITEEDYYRNLRHAASHIQLDGKGVSDLAKFGINMKQGDQLNLNDPKINSILEMEARKLQNIALRYIDSELKKSSLNSRW